MTNNSIFNLNNRGFKFIAFVFTLFIFWIIYTADTGGTIVFVKMIKFLPYPDKWGHFYLFGTLTLLLNLAFNSKRIRVGKFKLYVGTCLVSVFVFTEELSQGLLATRSMDIIDLLADGFGIALFSWITFYVTSRKRIKLKKLL